MLGDSPSRSGMKCKAFINIAPTESNIPDKLVLGITKVIVQCLLQEMGSHEMRERNFQSPNTYPLKLTTWQLKYGERAQDAHYREFRIVQFRSKRLSFCLLSTC